MRVPVQLQLQMQLQMQMQMQLQLPVGRRGGAEKGNTVFDIDSEEEKPLPVKDPSRDVGVAAMCET